MPELPEVEVARLGIAPSLVGETILGAVCRCAKLRQALDPALPTLLRGRKIVSLCRRGKYLLFECVAEGRKAAAGCLLIHLGMSGSLRLIAPQTPPAPHDHFDLILPQLVLRYRDPRRFGLIHWHASPDIESHPLLRDLGREPLSSDFDGKWLRASLSRRSGPIKPALMDAHLIVGIGNIYAAESLFRAGISPLRAANRISLARCEKLASSIRQTLIDAIAAGGSSLRDYVHSDGEPGCFQLGYAVYGRAGEKCPRCATAVRQVRQGGRSSFYCPRCQT